MDQDNPFPEDFVCPTTTYVCAGTTANRVLCKMTSSEDFVINCIYQQIWGLFEPSGELAQEYLRIRYMQFIEIETSHLHSTPVCRSACADIKLIGQTLVCPTMREENPIYIWY